MWDMPESTLRYWRCAGIGPAYVKLGGRFSVGHIISSDEPKASGRNDDGPLNVQLNLKPKIEESNRSGGRGAIDSKGRSAPDAANLANNWVARVDQENVSCR